MNRLVKKLRGCFAMGKERLSQQPRKGEGRGGIASGSDKCISYRALQGLLCKDHYGRFDRRGKKKRPPEGEL